jgi:hypothetical protein
MPRGLEEFLTDRFESYITYCCKESKIEKLGFLLDRCLLALSSLKSAPKRTEKIEAAISRTLPVHDFHVQ